MSCCPFCSIPHDEILASQGSAIAFRDRFPVTEGHTLVIPRRHVGNWFDLTPSEQADMMSLLDEVRSRIQQDDEIDGFNFGCNIGAAAGQTIPHVHLHLIPRRHGDMPDPTGGVRGVIPEKRNYRRPVLPVGVPHAEALIRGEDDPFFPHLVAHLSTAVRLDAAVAFAFRAGVEDLYPHLRELVERGGTVRILVGDYLDATEPDALLRLLDLGPNLHLRAFECADASFHPKSYICHTDHGGVAFVGSSNLSRTALRTGVEWNYRVLTHDDRRGFDSVRTGFEQLWSHPRTAPVDAPWVDHYSRRRRPPARGIEREVVAPDAALPVPEPHEIQQEALGALARSRSEGNTAGLVVLATGLGKTWLAAFDVVAVGATRVLFVAHREEILDQALATFRRIRPLARLGKFTGTTKDRDAEVLFASVQSLAKAASLDAFARDAFDYVIVDEFHHAAAATYRRVIAHFMPRFLLGLTATPDRSDEANLLSLCGDNLVYRCDIRTGVDRGLLSAFDYFGVTDDIVYAQVPWRRGRFDPAALELQHLVDRRAEDALRHWRTHCEGRRALGFCVSQRHADFVRDHFRAAGVRAAAIHSGPTSDPRAESLERLRTGELDIVFSVDMLSEGVDVPEVDGVLMLRPTESPIVWLQQLGRGLRRREGKRLRVVDYIGNHKSFLMKPQLLFGLESAGGDLRRLVGQLKVGELPVGLPNGCTASYDLGAVDILDTLLPAPAEGLREAYARLTAQLGRRPSAVEMYDAGFNPRTAGVEQGWCDFLLETDDLTDAERTVIRATRDVLFAFERTRMVKSYKMVVLRALLAADALPGAISLDDLAAACLALVRGSDFLREDFGGHATDERAMRRCLLENPIAHLSGEKGMFGLDVFRVEHEVLQVRVPKAEDCREAFGSLASEIVDWRFAEYRRRASGAGGADIVCKVNRAGAKAILMLPERTPSIPFGDVPVTVEDARCVARFVKIAVNVLVGPDGRTNVLDRVLRSWFGEGAGAPGTSHYVVFEKRADGYVLKPR